MRKAINAKREISRELILDAALALIDRGGMEKFSIRELAKSLRVFPTTIYWHLDGGRDTLLAAVLNRALKDVTPELLDSDDWEDWLRRLFRQYREAVRKRPHIASLIGSQLVTDAGVSPVISERVLTTLHRAGFEGTQLVDAYNAAIATMVGYVTLEFAVEPKQRSRTWAALFRRQLQELPAAEFPMVTQHLGHLSNRAFMLRWHNGTKVPLTGGFEMFIDAFLSGLEVIRSRSVDGL